MSAKLDLSNLPPEVREKVEAGLAKLSPEVRRKWEEQGSPLLARLVSGLAEQLEEAYRQGDRCAGEAALTLRLRPLRPGAARLVSGLAGTSGLSRQPPPVPGGRNESPASAWRTPDRPGRTASENVSPPRSAPSAQTLIRRTPPRGHYNDTIAPGDRPGFLQKVLLAAAVAGVLSWRYL